MGQAWSVDWLLPHRLLAAASHHPVLTVPGTSGAGLDLPRLCVVAGVLLGLLAWAASVLTAAGGFPGACRMNGCPAFPLCASWAEVDASGPIQQPVMPRRLRR